MKIKKDKPSFFSCLHKKINIQVFNFLNFSSSYLEEVTPISNGITPFEYSAGFLVV